MYLPALVSVQNDLGASADTVSATVSAYMGAVGVGQLVWGPLSDRFGRLRVLFSALLAYLALTVGCALSPDIYSLIVFRTVQGFVVGSTVVSAQAIIADIYAPEERGAAMGGFLAPMLVGPIIAPLVGGALADGFTWRATFYLLLVMTSLITLFCYLFVPETQHYRAAKRSPDIDSALFPKPRILSALELFHILVDPELYPHFSVMCSTFASMFTVLTIVPQFLAVAPYNLSPGIIGVCYLPVGVAMLLGALVGGASSDLSAKRYPQHPSGRLVFSLGGAYFTVIADVAFGFALAYRANLGAVLVTQSLVGFGQAFYMPGNLGYCSSIRQSAAGAAGAMAIFFCFASAAVSISVSVILSRVIGIDFYYLILAAITLGCSCFASYHIIIRLGELGTEGVSRLQKSYSARELLNSLSFRSVDAEEKSPP